MLQLRMFSPPKIKQLMLVLAAFAVLVIVPTVARADSINLEMTNRDQTGAPGQLLTFNGFFTNPSPGDAQFVNFTVNFNPTIVAFSGFSPQLLAFFVPTPQTLPSGATTPTIPMFSLTILPGAPAGATFIGTASVLSRSLTTGLMNTDTQEYRVTVVGGPEIPEPATMVLLGTGLAGIAGAARKRRKAKKSE